MGVCSVFPPVRFM